MTRDDGTTARMADLVVETTIEATPDSVWHALTEGIGEWWPGAFYAGGSEASRRMTFDARPGGRMIERWDGQDGLVWATVHSVERAVRIEASGLQFPRWGGPSMWFGVWELEPVGSSTRLRFTEHTIGRVGDGAVDEKRKGWTFLYGRSLKAHVEGAPPPTWED